jgi:DNA-3-methyladenine glycosylase II
MKIVVTPEGPLDAAATLARYRLWGEDPANRLLDGRFLRVLRLDGARLVPYALSWGDDLDDPRVTIHAPGARGRTVAGALVAETRALLGLDFDLPGFYRFAKGDRVLAPLAERLHGLRPTLSPTSLEMLLGAIAAQQVNLAFAVALRARLVRAYGTPCSIGGEAVHAFPDAAVLAGAAPADLRAMQFSTQKASSIVAVASAVASGALATAALAACDDAAVIERITSVRGLGRWSADWFLARCLGRGGVCAAGDLAVRKAFDRHYGRGRALSETAIRTRAARWGPYQNLAIHYLLAGMRLARAGTGGGT